MKLVYIDNLLPAKIGDLVQNFRGVKGIIHHFVPPHRSASTGKISIREAGGQEHYNYVSVWGMEWIDDG